MPALALPVPVSLPPTFLLCPPPPPRTTTSIHDVTHPVSHRALGTPGRRGRLACPLAHTSCTAVCDSNCIDSPGEDGAPDRSRTTDYCAARPAGVSCARQAWRARPPSRLALRLVPLLCILPPLCHVSCVSRWPAKRCATWSTKELRWCPGRAAVPVHGQATQ
jgi:hypothetical protein